MPKVTRTKSTLVLRGKAADGTATLKVLGKVSTEAAALIAENKRESDEIGYMPLTYEMEEEDFMAAGKLVTDWENTPLFPTFKSCPKSAAELKKAMKN